MRHFPVVRTTLGAVRGTLEDGVQSFKGIPYGASTSGERRFRPPAPPEPWNREMDANEFGYSAPQLSRRHALDVYRTRGYSDERAEQQMAMIAERFGMPRGINERQSEDCLALNVWTPAADSDKRPVLVWLHGGGWVAGSAHWPQTRGGRLSAHTDIVVVTVNHRLGAFGYLNLSDIGGPDFAESARVGVLDLVAALEWVRDNAAAFGGDPNCVTIAGESGGGEKVAALLATPEAQGLFHRAVMQSSLGATGFPSWESSLNVANEFVAKVGAAGVRALQDLPAELVVDTTVALARGLATRRGSQLVSRVRRTFNPPDIFAPPLTGAPNSFTNAPTIASGTEDVPLMIGCNSADIMPFTEVNDDAQVAAHFAGTLGAEAATIVARYRDILPDATARDLMIAIATDHVMRIPTIRYAERRARTARAPVFLYLLTWGTPIFDGTPRAVHTTDVPLMFDNVHTAPFVQAGQDPQTMATRMCETWAAFARDGVPKHHELPEWQPFTSEERATMVLDSTCALTSDAFAEQRKIWEPYGDEQLGGNSEPG